MPQTDDFLANILDNVHYTPPSNGAGEEIECEIAPKELPNGHTLHGYRIMQTLGAGGFGITYLAEEKSLERRVVLKENFPDSLCHRESGTLDVVLSSPERGDETFIWAHNNFMREARLLASLDHPNIAKVYSFFSAHRTSYYVTEYIEGKSFADVVQDYNSHKLAIPQEALLGVMIRVLDALDYLHQRNLLHRDIKPDNILINRQGLPILIDFGAAREEFGDSDSSIVESMGFSPSEQSSPDGNMGPWTDLYAFGATLYYVLTGNCLPGCRQRDLFDTADPITEHPSLSKQFDKRILQSIHRAIRPAISERYQSAAEWIADLDIG